MNTKRLIHVDFNGTALQVPSGIKAIELLAEHPHKGKLHPLGALVSYRLTGLHYELVSDCIVDTIDYQTKEGAAIYRRTASLILYEAAQQLFPGARVEIGQSGGQGYFFDVVLPGDEPIEANQVASLKNRMRRIVKDDIPLIPVRISVEEAIGTFLKTGYDEKAQLLETSPYSKVWWIDTGRFKDVLHGPLAPSTGAIDMFQVEPYEDGLILRFPTREYELRPMRRKPVKLFATYKETRAWNQVIGVHNVGQLNAAVLRDEAPEIIRIAEGFHEKKIVRIADEIASRRDSIKLVLIAGPSSSGKTTFTKRLGVQLRVNGLNPVALSMDNYYVDRDKTPRFPDGTYNFESLKALDVKLLNAHLKQLMDGDLVETPIFSFTTGRRQDDRTIPLKLDPEHVLIMEGIHCLNEKISRTVPRNAKFKIYASALTQLIIDSHSRIFTSDTRLIRRIVRDRLFRGYSAEQTIHQWPSVRSGENRYIFPFQEDADIMFNSALVYEMGVLKNYAHRFLLTVPRSGPTYTEAHRLLNFLELFVTIFPEEVPQNSLLREFIGGSTFDY